MKPFENCHSLKVAKEAKPLELNDLAEREGFYYRHYLQVTMKPALR
jgi:hypothetical protein